MDFDPHSVKWKCCCCSLPGGMRLLASFEFAFCIVTGGLTMYNILHQKPEDLTANEVCLVGLMLFVALTSVMLIIGVQKHSPQLIYPSLLARGLATLFLAVFGVSSVFSSSRSQGLHGHNRYLTHDQNSTSSVNKDEPNMALRLVLFVFAMLFLTVIIFYTAYLIVRLINYEQSYAKLKERRSSLIQAGMIDPDAPTPHNYSRRASTA